jgi:PKHD-type hydroxylase
MLLHIPQVLTPDELREARSLLASAQWVPGGASAGRQAVQAKNNEQLSQQDPGTHALQKFVLTALDRNPLFFSAALPRRIYPPMFNRYGGERNTYGNHVDNAIRYAAQAGQRVRTDVSCTLFLADPADYDGGELVIEDTIGNQRMKLPAGDMLLYPSTSVHRVEPVTRGHRLACFFWVESMVRGAEQRRLLFDMDMSLVRLREQHGEGGVAIALTGTYHNLLRMWADV